MSSEKRCHAQRHDLRRGRLRRGRHRRGRVPRQQQHHEQRHRRGGPRRPRGPRGGRQLHVDGRARGGRDAEVHPDRDVRGRRAVQPGVGRDLAEERNQPEEVLGVPVCILECLRHVSLSLILRASEDTYLSQNFVKSILH